MGSSGKKCQYDWQYASGFAGIDREARPDGEDSTIFSRYLILQVGGIKFRFAREPGYPELLHIYARHLNGAQAGDLGLVQWSIRVE
jgi:hypothetical protein